MKITEIEGYENLASKNDIKELSLEIKELKKDLEAFILGREIVALRWVVGVQITYFFGTLAAIWFLITHH